MLRPDFSHRGPPMLLQDEHSSPSSPATSIACANVSNQSLFSGQVRRQISLEMPYGDEAEPPGTGERMRVMWIFNSIFL